MIVRYPKALVVSFLVGFGFVGLLLLLKSFGVEGHLPVHPINSTMPWWLG